MKKKWYQTKSFITGFIMALGITAVFAAGIPEKMVTDSLVLGKGDSTDTKIIEFNTGDSPNNVSLEVDDSKNTTLDTNQLTLGDGTDTAQSLIFNQNTSDITFGVDGVQAAFINSEQLTIGDGNPIDSTLIFDRGGSNAFIRWNETNGQIELSNDGIITSAIVTGNVTTEPNLVENVSTKTSVAVSALTIDLTIANGIATPSGTSPVRIAFRDVVADDGAYNILSIETALSIVIPSGAKLSHINNVDGFIYVYVLDNAGVAELAISSALKDDSSRQTSLTISSGADDDDLYSTTGRTDVPIRLIARLTSNQTVTGDWAADVTENSPGPHIFTDIEAKLFKKVSTNDPAPQEILVVSAQIQLSTGTPVLISELGDWIDSFVDNGVGDVTITFDSGLWANGPQCACISETARSCASASGGFASTTVFRIVISDSSAVPEDRNFTIVCLGQI